MLLDEDGNALQHYGIIRRSGRYPWGSGGNYGSGGSGTVIQRSRSFLDLTEYLRKEMNLSETEVAKYVGMTTTELRATKSIAKNQIRSANIAYAERLKEKGYSNVAIGNKMGINESSVRELLAPGAKARTDQLTSISNMLKKEVEEKGYIDVGTGVDAQLGISDTKLKAALAIMESEGYGVETFKVEQLGTGQMTSVKVLGPKGMDQREAWLNRSNIRQIQEFSEDGGNTFLGIKKPMSIDQSRVAIKYAEDGGLEADGLMYIRPGVEDVSIGNSRYAQVRVAVDGTHYIKGMAIYKDDLPPGVDIMFNTNKSDTGNKLDALKPMKTVKQTGEIDWDNPFGSYIKRQQLDLVDGKEVLKSTMNIVNEEGDWEKWSKNLSSQMLSKQNRALAKEQLGKLYSDKEMEFEEIMSLTNPTVKEYMLNKFADSADSASVHLKGAAMPRMRNSVLIPVPEMKETEVYAPNFKNGERVVLIRHPHGGTFEIPELTVNNRNPKAKSLLGQAADAIGINSKVAERLSGADFDGDTVLTIPNNSGKILSTPALKELKHFDAKMDYRETPGMKYMTKGNLQNEMGRISNLITDLTIMGADQGEIARAVKHSMVVIDAEKHKLDYKRSEKDQGIAALRQKYLDGANKGASTLISKASSQKYVPERQLRKASDGGPIDPTTGKKVWVETGRTKPNKQGVDKPRTSKVEKLALTDDAFTLSSGTPIEQIYAQHSNRLKALANRARKETLVQKPIPYSPSAKKTYAKEVAELDAALNLVHKNKPRERQAQILGNAIYRQKLQDDPHMDKDDRKKIKYQALDEARVRTGAYKDRVQLEPRHWEAIQAGAISTNKLKEVMMNSDLEQIKRLATPRPEVLMTSQNTARAQAMLNRGYTQAEVAQHLGVSLTTLKNGLGS